VVVISVSATDSMFIAAWRFVDVCNDLFNFDLKLGRDGFRDVEMRTFLSNDSCGAWWDCVGLINDWECGCGANAATSLLTLPADRMMNDNIADFILLY